MVFERVPPPPSGRFRVRIAGRSAAVTVEAVASEDVVVEGKGHAHLSVTPGTDDEPTTVEVRTSSDKVTVLCPAGTDVLAGVTSGRISLEGPLGDVHVMTASGSVEIEEAESVDVRSKSGRVRVGICHGPCRLMTKSGSVEVDAAGTIDAAVKSGKVTVDQVGGGRIYAASGSVSIGSTGAGDLEVRVMSGSVRIDVPRDARPDVRARARSGRVTCDCEPGDDFVVDVATASGSVVVGCT